MENSIKWFNAIVAVPSRKNISDFKKQEIKSCQPIFVNYLLEDVTKTIYNNTNKKTYKKVPKNYYGKIKYKL